MFEFLQQVDSKPAPFEFYTAETLWNDAHISQQMLQFHLNPDLEPASRNQGFIEASIDWMKERFRIGPDCHIADFGCGPGLYTLPFAELGASVTGIDFSRRSIAYAREQALNKGLDIDYRQQNYLDFASEKRFDLITLIYCDFCPLSPVQRNQLMEVFHRHLNDDGAVLLDVFSLQAFNSRQENTCFERRLMDGFWSDQDYFGFAKTMKYAQEKVCLDKYTIVEMSRQWQVYNWLQYFSLASVKREFTESGFEITEYYSDVAGNAYHEDSEVIALVARKI
nr:class I SAM-dependent methyltransferase [uncultured Desulfuromonas sp.]